jgi:hypothetical protein
MIQKNISCENSTNIIEISDNSQNSINDILLQTLNKLLEENESIKLRLFLKENIDFVINNNLIENLSDEIYVDSESWKILCNFYNLINQKINLILNLKKWKDIYNNDFFWNLTTPDQIEFLNHLKIQFLSIYDCSHGGSVYHLKLMQIFQSNNYNYYQIMEDAEDRLKRILVLFGSKIFETLEIPLITIRDLYNLSNDQILKYFTTIFKSIKQLLDGIIELFENFNLNCSNLNILLNPN